MHSKKPVIYFSVTNDVMNDQRVNRIALTLYEQGLKVVVVGVHRKRPLVPSDFPFKVVLLRSPFQKGFLFYAAFNMLLFFYLLPRKNKALVANDLDSLPANFIVSKLCNCPLVFDSHELFTEVPEIQHRPFVKAFWARIENMLVPRLKHCYTVCQSIATIYEKKYSTKFSVVRNVPFRKELACKSDFFSGQRANKKIIMYQGALNIGRGIESVILAMKQLEGAILVIAGKGDIEQQLHILVATNQLSEKVLFVGSLKPKQLHEYTCMAHVGFSLEEAIGLNYYYALPNKLFDYIQAEVPVLVSNFPEMAAIVNQYQIGLTVNDNRPDTLAAAFAEILFNESKRAVWKANLKKAAEELCWENEKNRLLDVYKTAQIV